MSIKPIDLQILIGQMDHVSRRQMLEDKAAGKQQSLKGEKIAKQEILRDHAVNESSHSSEESPVPLENKKEGKEKKRKYRKPSSALSKDGRHSFKEPNLGQIIDISK